MNQDGTIIDSSAQHNSRQFRCRPTLTKGQVYLQPAVFFCKSAFKRKPHRKHSEGLFFPISPQKLKDNQPFVLVKHNGTDYIQTTSVGMLRKFAGLQ